MPSSPPKCNLLEGNYYYNYSIIKEATLYVSFNVGSIPPHGG